MHDIFYITHQHSQQERFYRITGSENLTWVGAQSQICSCQLNQLVFALWCFFGSNIPLKKEKEKKKRILVVRALSTRVGKSPPLCVTLDTRPCRHNHISTAPTWRNCSRLHTSWAWINEVGHNTHTNRVIQLSSKSTAINTRVHRTQIFLEENDI